MSPCLLRLGDNTESQYHEALAIIRCGQEDLAAHPRPDMPGFELVSSVEIEQEEKYQTQLMQEARMRVAIARDKKQFPRDANE